MCTFTIYQDGQIRINETCSTNGIVEKCKNRLNIGREIWREEVAWSSAFSRKNGLVSRKSDIILECYMPTKGNGCVAVNRTRCYASLPFSLLAAHFSALTDHINTRICRNMVKWCVRVFITKRNVRFIRAFYGAGLGRWNTGIVSSNPIRGLNVSGCSVSWCPV